MIREKWQIESGYRELCVETLRENLAPLRAKCGLSQEELAGILGISRQTYCAFETGKRPLPWNTYLSILFVYQELDETRRMLHELQIFPTELFRRLNRELPDRELDCGYGERCL